MARPQRDLFTVVVHTLLVRDDRLFLLHRAHTGFLDGYFGPPGGHQRLGESVSEAARRECFEETGATPEDLQPFCVLPYIAGRHQGINLLFEVRRFTGEPHIAEPEFFDDCCWASPANLPRNTLPWFADALAMQSKSWYRERLWG